MHPLEDAVDAMAYDTAFSGVVRIDRLGVVELSKAYGLADRGHTIPNTIETQFAIASATKGLTALAVVSLIDDGALHLDTTVRSVLGGDLPLIDDRVTVEHLLAHRSGIGDYVERKRITRSPTSCCRCPCTSLRRPSSISRCSAVMPPCFLRVSGSRTATVATWCSL